MPELSKPATKNVTAAISPQLSPTLSVTPSPSITPTPLVLVGAGDISICGQDGDDQTAALLDEIPGFVFTAGDNANEEGTWREFSECYASSWGRHLGRTLPAAGNHEYAGGDADAYFRYFGQAAGDPEKGYYSLNLGDWHVLVLNSNCTKVGGCGVDSPQARWLQADLAENLHPCTLAIWHEARFSSGLAGSAIQMSAFWNILYAGGAELVVSGHDHDYERFAPLNAEGEIDRKHGVRQFVVGTGGASRRGFEHVLPQSEAHRSGTYGVLKLTLLADRYAWEFIPVAGDNYSDLGGERCH